MNKLFVVLSAALLTILLTQEYLFTIAPLKTLELKLIDNRFQERGKIDLGDSAKVIIVEITQDSYDQIPPPYNKWPWPRFIFAKVINNLMNAGVKAVGIDIDMPGSDQFSPLNDSLMRTAIRKSGKVVVAGKINESTEQKIEEGKSWIGKTNENYDNIFYTADSSVGIVQPPADYDGVFRRYLPFRYTGITNKKIPSFGFALLNKYYGLKSSATAQREGGNFTLGNKNIPQYDPTSVLINFYGPNGTFPRVKLIDVLDDKNFKTIDELETGVDLNTWDTPDGGWLYSGKFKDKVVIIGSTMPEDRDLLPTSFAEGKQKGDNMMYGVEFHANVIQNILSNNFLYRQSRGSEILVILFFTFIMFYGSSAVRKIKLKIGALVEIINVILVLLLIFVIYEFSIYLFIHNQLVTAVVSPSLAVVVGYFSSTAYHFLRERQQNVLIKGMFSQYVSKHVVNELLSNPAKLQLGGEKKNVSILFSDIAGFTTFSENKQPEELVRFINEYLNEMTEIILANDGTLDKYLGDAVMAFWGAPIELEDHAFRACAAAIEMQKKVRELSAKWIQSGESAIQVRIGVNSGDVIVGNIGGVKRFDYTVMGDNVNLASRLEGANKEYGTRIMISERTFDFVKSKFIARELDLIRVKGKTKPTKVFELIGLAGDKENETKLSSLNDYLKGLEFYKSRNFSPAISHFKKSYEFSNDFPSNVYVMRCQSYLETPPDANWDGVFEMKTK